MNVDLPPLSAFTPDPAVARARTSRDTLTLAVQAEPGPVLIGREDMTGTANAGALGADGCASFRAAIGVCEDLPLTITF